MKKLVIAEKPSVAADLARVLGKVPKKGDYFEDGEWVISSALGHVVELVMPEKIDKKYSKWTLDNLPILPKTFRLQASEKTKKKYEELKRLMSRKDIGVVINACDAGREGELIFTYLYEKAGCDKPVERLWMSSMTPAAIRKAFASLRQGESMQPLQDAARSRSESDWLIGLNATRGATVTFGRRGGTAATVGRVQTPTLAMVCAREAEIRDFQPRDYWEIDGTFAIAKGTYNGLYQKPDFKKGDDEHDRASRLWREEEARRIVEECAAAETAEVSEERKRSRQIAPRLYDLTTLQREASSRFGYPAGLTLNIAQALYERHKMITYPRTDSRALPEDYGSNCQSVLKKLDDPYRPFADEIIGENRVRPSDRRVFNNAQVSDHFAIIPTDQPGKTLKDNERKIYDMIVRRFLAVFFPPAEFDVTTRLSRIGEHTFKTEGKVLAVPGWLAVYGKDQLGEDTLPPLSADDGDPARAGVEAVELRGEATKPPPRLTESTLLSAMEHAGRGVEDEELAEAMKERGLGTPATRAGIIDHLVREKYIERVGREILPTPKGEALIDFLKAFDIEMLTSPAMTGEWEYKLRQIEEGKLSREAFMKGIREATTTIVEAMKNPPAPEASKLTCPFDDKPMMEDFRGYKSTATYTANNREYPLVSINKVIGNRAMSEEEIATLLRERELGPLDGFRSRNGKAFSAILKLEQNDKGGWRVTFDFGNDGNGENDSPEDLARFPVVAKCPVDQAPVHETPNAYVCVNHALDGEDKCPFRISRTILSRTIEREEFQALVEKGRSPLLKGFRSNKTKRLFDAHLILKPGGQIGFEFPERPRKTARKSAAKRAAKKAK